MAVCEPGGRYRLGHLDLRSIRGPRRPLLHPTLARRYRAVKRCIQRGHNRMPKRDTTFAIRLAMVTPDPPAKRSPPNRLSSFKRAEPESPPAEKTPFSALTTI